MGKKYLVSVVLNVRIRLHLVDSWIKNIDGKGVGLTSLVIFPQKWTRSKPGTSEATLSLHCDLGI